MKPYYDDGKGIVIYCGDCREILPTFADGSFDVVATDPPYPNLKGGAVIRWDNGVVPRNRNTVTVGEPWGSDLSPLSHCARIARVGAMVFCSWQSLEQIPPLVTGKRIALITWLKRNTSPSVNNAPRFMSEFIWALQFGAGANWRAIETVIDIPKLAAGCMATERIVIDDGAAIHPAQKPIALMTRLLKPFNGRVCDPYMGLGTTLIAASLMGLPCVGIEQDESYCEIAARRLSQEVLEFPQPQVQSAPPAPTPDLFGDGRAA